MRFYGLLITYLPAFLSHACLLVCHVPASVCHVPSYLPACHVPTPFTYMHDDRTYHFALLYHPVLQVIARQQTRSQRKP